MEAAKTGQKASTAASCEGSAARCKALTVVVRRNQDICNSLQHQCDIWPGMSAHNI